MYLTKYNVMYSKFNKYTLIFLYDYGVASDIVFCQPYTAWKPNKSICPLQQIHTCSCTFLVISTHRKSSVHSMFVHQWSPVGAGCNRLTIVSSCLAAATNSSNVISPLPSLSTLLKSLSANSLHDCPCKNSSSASTSETDLNAGKKIVDSDIHKQSTIV